MRATSTLLALCSVAAAQQQIPILDQAKAWFSKATAAASSAVASASAPSVPNPVSVGASAIASSQVEPLTVNNYKTLLTHRAATATPGIEEWLVYVTGGNKTCFGRCGPAEEQWNRSVPILATSKNAPQLALLDCERDAVLCHAWSIGPPSLIHITLPAPAADQSQAPITTRFINLNRTTVTSDEIASIHTQQKYKETEPYEGFWHPFDSPFAKSGANIYLGYFVVYFSMIPNWAFMIGVSMLSRTIMSRRMGPDPVRAGGQGGPGAAAPAGQRPAGRT
ncbi:Nuclear migration protein NUM1 [Sphaceloma murrayae]|uniref:Nuclear migration protein NUM1 n=1 Tax=Sphaceloma murrayae TaxID=2082308 RepID=A0A2K1QP02_9PEZI|nr:Nuclear migration protein NUM1 [Sphaceloma murrayae]